MSFSKGLLFKEVPFAIGADMDNTEKFSGKADVYERFRPSYPQALYDFISRRFLPERDGTVIDTGSGTGKFALPLAPLCGRLICVEPNADMRRKLCANAAGRDNVEVISSAAENIPLPPASAELITAAQAFHWFDRAAFGRECARLLRSGGHVALIWNIRKSCDIRDELYSVNKKYCPLFGGFSGGYSDKDIRSFDDFFAKGTSDVASFPNDTVLFGEEEFVGRCLSSSYAPAPGSDGHTAYVVALAELYDRYACGGRLTVPMDAVMFFGKVY